jgi:hypothetical protein
VAGGVLLHDLVAVARGHVERREHRPMHRVDQGRKLRLAAAFDQIDPDERHSSRLLRHLA